MNCPNCNKEVSPEWNVCPHCGYNPVKCSNPSCNAGWLPQEAKFCPECGKMLEETSILPIPKVKEENRNVSIGDILCTDNTTVPSSAWPVAGKTAMGVVFYVDNTGKHGWAVHLQDQGKCKWTERGKESLVYGVHTCGTEKEALADEDGCANTKALRAAGNAFVYPAAYAVDFGLGWYLPALGQLKKLYNLRERLNTSLLKVKGEEIKRVLYWSSTQYDDSYAWAVRYDGGFVGYANKSHSHSVRSVRAF